MKALAAKYRSLTDKIDFLPPLLARLTLGFTFIQAGWGKFGRLDNIAGYFDSLGIPAASLQAPLVASVEFVGGLLILIGLGTRYASLFLIAVMTVALFTAHKDEIEGLSDLFSQAPFLYILLFIWLTVAGAGRFSVDHKLCRKKNTNPNP